MGSGVAGLTWFAKSSGSLLKVFLVSEEVGLEPCVAAVELEGVEGGGGRVLVVKWTPPVTFLGFLLGFQSLSSQQGE